MLPGCLRSAVLLSLFFAAATPPIANAATLRFKSEFIVDKWSATISGTLTVPKGTGPFPAVIFLHPCGGMTNAVQQAQAGHAEILKQNGFAVLLLDSFGARDLNGGKACDGPLAGLASAFLMDDAFNAMKVLRQNDKIDANNVFLAGQSLGAIAAIRAATTLYSPRDQAFRAIAAWYPSCAVLHGGANEIKSPLIVFAAGKDDWTPADPCRQAKVKGASYEVIVYPDALHSFDQPIKKMRYHGHMLGHDARATASTREKMIAFFKRNLKK